MKIQLVIERKKIYRKKKECNNLVISKLLLLNYLWRFLCNKQEIQLQNAELSVSI